MSNGEITCKDLCKTYNIGAPNEFTALKGLNRVREVDASEPDKLSGHAHQG